MPLAEARRQPGSDSAGRAIRAPDFCQRRSTYTPGNFWRGLRVEIGEWLIDRTAIRTRLVEEEPQVDDREKTIE